MGETHEVILEFEKDLQKKENIALTEPQKALVPVTAERQLAPVVQEWFEELKTKVLTHYPDPMIKSLLFTSTNSGCGCSTAAVGFASSLAMDQQLDVLLVEVNMRTPSFHNLFKGQSTCGLSDICNEDHQTTPLMTRAGLGNLYVITCDGEDLRPAALFQSSRFNEFITRMRERFDYVILDAPPVQGFSETRIISAKCDGTVLVVESGKTRRQAALRAKKDLEAAGGKFLGVVINRRKYHIPDWLYRRV